MSEVEHFDFLVLGAGLSGIGSAVYYLKEFPGANKPETNLRGHEKKMAIFEGRDCIGGTWNLFKYPGIRSDSSMMTFAFSFKPWEDHAHSIAPANLINDYIVSTAEEYGVTPHIRFGHKATRMSWDSETRRWTIRFERKQNDKTEDVIVSASFLQVCTGYYSYKAGYTPTGGPWEQLRNEFKGDIIHPQHWPEGFNYDNKKVVVVGSGATAITLVPAMAEKASHVTMLQRSPTWMISMKTSVVLPFWLRWLPTTTAARCIRIIDIFLGWVSFKLCRAFPNFIGSRLLSDLRVKEKISSEEVKRHFTPRYKLWDERFCVVANGDLFKRMREGKASVVTGEIKRFVENGVEVSTKETDAPPTFIEADVIVTATGLNVELFGGAVVEVDGVEVVMSERIVYRGTMISGVPNFAIAIGYTNASWTLKIELAFTFLMRMLSYMDERNLSVVIPTPKPDVSVTNRSVFDLASNYVKRARPLLPSQGSKSPWVVLNSYPRDFLQMAYGSVNDGSLSYM